MNALSTSNHEVLCNKSEKLSVFYFAEKVSRKVIKKTADIKEEINRSCVIFATLMVVIPHDIPKFQGNFVSLQTFLSKSSDAFLKKNLNVTI